MFDRGIPGLILLGLMAFACHAQEPLNSKMVEEKSYQLLVDKNWVELIQFGQSALDEDIDYFYLRLRMGIAYYDQLRYRQAIRQFQKALAFNAEDSTAQEYYYYSLLYAGQFDEARRYAASVPDPLRTKLGVDRMKVVNLMYAEAGPKISSRNDLYANAVYFQIGLNHSVGNKFSLSHVYNYYGQNLLDGPFSQYQYYLAANIPLGKGWSLSPAFHVVGQKLDSAIFVSGGPGRPPMNSYISLTSTSFVGSMALAKRYSFADVAYATTISNVEGYAQYIQQLTVTLYPGASNKFYLGNIAYYHWEKYFGGTVAMNPYLGWKPGKALALQLLYFTNQQVNLIERNGYFVNNSPDLTTSRWTGVADVKLSEHVNLYGIFAYENKEMTSGTTYSYSSYILGIKIIP